MSAIEKPPRFDVGQELTAAALNNLGTWGAQYAAFTVSALCAMHSALNGIVVEVDRGGTAAPSWTLNGDTFEHEAIRVLRCDGRPLIIRRGKCRISEGQFLGVVAENELTAYGCLKVVDQASDALFERRGKSVLCLWSPLLIGSTSYLCTALRQMSDEARALVGQLNPRFAAYEPTLRQVAITTSGVPACSAMPPIRLLADLLGVGQGIDSSHEEIVNVMKSLAEQMQGLRDSPELSIRRGAISDITGAWRRVEFTRASTEEQLRVLGVHGGEPFAADYWRTEAPEGAVIANPTIPAGAAQFWVWFPQPTGEQLISFETLDGRRISA